MNIVLVVIDTLRYDYIGANGNGWIQTPNLDRLAGESWCFDRAFCSSFPTIPHRTDVMTGVYGRPFYVWRPLPFDALPLPWLLAGAGFATQLIHDTPHLVNGGHNFDWPFHAWTFIRGAEVDRPWINDRRDWPENWARDRLFDCLGEDAPGKDRTVITYCRANRARKRPEDWNCARLFLAARDFLRENARRENFFLWIDCFDPHEPWDVPPEFMLKYERAPGYDGRVDPRSFGGRENKRLSEAARKRIAAMYAGKVSWVDHWLGKFLDALEETGLAKNTAVVLTADHGTNVGEGGQFGKKWVLRQQEAHVPLLVRVPEGDRGRSGIIVQPHDVFATVLALAGVTPPAGTDGHDVLAVARAGAPGPRRIALAGHSTPWQSDSVLFTALDEQWVMQVRPRVEDCRLTPLGSLKNVEQDHPDVVAALHSAAWDEVQRRGADPRAVAWARSGGEGPVPKTAGEPLPPGYYHYYDRLYLKD